MTCIGCGGYWGGACAGGVSNSATCDAITFASHFWSENGAMRRALKNTWHEQGETTYSLKLSQNIFADTVLIKVTFNGMDDLIYDRAVDARLIDGEWMSSFVLVKHEWH